MSLTAAPVAGVAAAPEREPWVVRACQGLLDATTIALASWTVVYHVCLLAGLGVPTALTGWVMVTAGVALLLRRWRPAVATTDAASVIHPSGATRGRLVLGVTATAAVLAAVAMALRAPWPVVVVLWLLAGAGGALASALSRPAEWSRATTPGSGRDAWFAVGCATGLAVLSTLTLRPNPDDLYYVNLAQWVVDHGTFPLRDTIFSDQRFSMSSFPPVASYDALTGTVARLLGTPAGTVIYVLVPPLATFLAVLALWRLLRVWGVRPLWLALAVALVFLLFDGGPGYQTPGNLFLTRLWQGKVVLMCVGLPTLLVLALQHVRRPSRHTLARLALGGTAAVGLSTSAMFVVPVVALAGAAPLLHHRPRAALAGVAAMAAYPVVGGVGTVLAGGHSADDFGTRRLYRFDPEWFGHQIFLDGVIALIAVAAVLLGPLLLPRSPARLTTALLALAVGVTFVPGVTRLSYDLLGLGPTLWRVSWVLVIAALVGVLSAAAVRAGRLGALVPVAVVAAMVLGGTPLWSTSLGARLVAAPHWQRSEGSRRAAASVIEDLRPGQVVLAPPEVSITIDVTTTRVKTVAPRKYFMDYLAGEPGFHYRERGRLMDFVDPPNGRRSDPATIPADLRTVGVTEICLRAEDTAPEQALLRGLGWTDATRTSAFTCLHLTGAVRTRGRPGG